MSEIIWSLWTRAREEDEVCCPKSYQKEKKSQGSHDNEN